MATIIDLESYRRVAPAPQEVPPMATRYSIEQRAGHAVMDANETGPGSAALFALLDYECSNVIIVDEGGRPYLYDPEEHERARRYFERFGFDIDAFEHADNLHAHWLTLHDFHRPFVRWAIKEPDHFLVMTAGMSPDYGHYVAAIVSGDTGMAARFSHRVILGQCGLA